MKIFIGSSRESIEAMEWVALCLEDFGHQAVKWNEVGLFPPGEDSLSSLTELSKSVDAAVFIFGEDDKVWYRGDAAYQPRDNVLIEWGLFTGQLGPRKCIICRNGTPRISTDILGLTVVDIGEASRNRAKSELRIWASRLKAQPVDLASLYPIVEVYQARSSARTEIYEAARRMVESAQESIRVLSHHASGHLESPARDAYFDRLEEKVLSKYGAEEVFRYHHIYQLKSRDSEFSEKTVGGRGFRHFERLRGLSSNKALSRTKVTFSKVAIIADTALIIIDRKSALIGLLHTSSAGMVVAIAIEITDVSGRLIESLVDLFDSIEAGPLPEPFAAKGAEKLGRREEDG